jgi:hypothetical protein
MVDVDLSSGFGLGAAIFKGAMAWLIRLRHEVERLRSCSLGDWVIRAGAMLESELDQLSTLLESMCALFLFF